jgi:hypothetical protein
MQFAAHGNLRGDLLTQRFTYALRKGLSPAATVCQYAFHLMQIGLASLECLQGSMAICHICRRHHHGMREPLRVYGNVALDSRDLLARVIALEPRCVRVLVLCASKIKDSLQALRLRFSRAAPT